MQGKFYRLYHKYTAENAICVLLSWNKPITLWENCFLPINESCSQLVYITRYFIGYITSKLQSKAYACCYLETNLYSSGKQSNRFALGQWHAYSFLCCFRSVSICDITYKMRGHVLSTRKLDARSLYITMHAYRCKLSKWYKKELQIGYSVTT